MSETKASRAKNKARHIRGKTVAVVVGASLLIGACGGKPASSSSKGSCENIPTKAAESPSKPLEIGGTISDMPILNPEEAGIGACFTLRPGQTRAPQDLGIIYGPGESTALEDSFANPKPGERVGFLLTSNNGIIEASFIIFNDKTKRINDISPSFDIAQGTHTLFGYLEPGGEYALQTDSDRGPDNALTVRVVGLAAGRVGSPSGPPLPAAPVAAQTI